MEGYGLQPDFVFQHGVWFFLLGLAMGLAVYFLPAYIAIRRKHQQRIDILVINIFLGLSGIGWLVALAWALSGENELDDRENESARREPSPRVPPTLDKEV